MLTQPPDRVSYRLLTPSDDDLRSIRHYEIKAGILNRQIELRDLVDLRFIPEHIRSIPIAEE